MIRALPVMLLLAGCPKAAQPDGTVLSAGDLATLRDAQALVRVTASLPDVQESPHACRAFVYLDFIVDQVVAVGGQLQAAPTCLSAAEADSRHCPGLPPVSDPILSEAAADKARDTAEVVELMVLTVKDSHVGDPVVSAWADLAVQRLTDVGTEIVAELAEPDDLIAVPEVCVRD